MKDPQEFHSDIDVNRPNSLLDTSVNVGHCCLFFSIKVIIFFRLFVYASANSVNFSVFCSVPDVTKSFDFLGVLRILMSLCSFRAGTSYDQLTSYLSAVQSVMHLLFRWRLSSKSVLQVYSSIVIPFWEVVLRFWNWALQSLIWNARFCHKFFKFFKLLYC